MPSEYTRNLGLEKPATGEQAGTWGNTANNDYDFIDVATDGNTAINITNAGFLLKTEDGVATSGRNKVIVWTGSLSADGVTVNILPNDAQKLYFMVNATAGGRSITFSQGTGGDFVLGPGLSAIIFSDGMGNSAQVQGMLSSAQFATLTVQAQASNSSSIRAQASATVNHIEFWKDPARSVGASIGLTIPSPGYLLGNDLVFGVYTSGIWTQCLRIGVDMISVTRLLNVLQREVAASDTVLGGYNAAAIEIRETNLVEADAGKTGVEYAPRISFHWKGRGAAQIGMTSTGVLQAMNPDGSLGPLQVSVLSVTTVNSETTNAATVNGGTVNATVKLVTPLIEGLSAATLTLGTLSVGTVNATTLTGNLTGTWKGYGAIASGVPPGAYQVIASEGNGYVYFGFINTVSADNGTTAIGRVYASGVGDPFIRYYTLANFAAQIAQHLPSSTVWTANQNQNGFSLTSGDGIVRIGNNLLFQGNEIADASITFDNINFSTGGGGNIVVKFRDNTGLHKKFMSFSGEAVGYPKP